MWLKSNYSDAPDEQAEEDANPRSSRRHALEIMATAALAAATSGCYEPAETRAAKGPFVQVKDAGFIRDGSPWRFAGTNCYSLHESSHEVIDGILEDAKSMGLAVIRSWAFSDGAGRPAALHRAPYNYPDQAYDPLDYTIYKAGQLGLKLVLPLVNNWPDYGGMQQYVSWFLGLSDDTYADSVHHDRFYTDPAIRACFLAYVDQLIRRTNRYSGKRYKDDPTIMTWELANEPRNRSDKTGRGILDWADEVSSHIKGVAAHQLVAIGDEGLGLNRNGNNEDPYSANEGNSWLTLSSLAAVDYATVHLYPQAWKQTRSSGIDPVRWGSEWITRHAVEARKMAKPVVLEEFGLHIDAVDGIPSARSRDRAYEAWLSQAEQTGFAGTQFWMLTGLKDDGVSYLNQDGYEVVYPSPTASIIANHARNMTINL